MPFPKRGQKKLRSSSIKTADRVHRFSPLRQKPVRSLSVIRMVYIERSSMAPTRPVCLVDSVLRDQPRDLNKDDGALGRNR